MSAVPVVHEPAFTSHGLLTGARRSVPLALTDGAYGVLFGVLARQAGLSLPEAVLMSGLVYAGSAQFVALGLWAAPVPVASLVLTTLMVNLRYLLMGATLWPWLARLSGVRRYGLLALLSDESWALSTAEYEAGRSDGAFLLGSGVVLYVAWVSGTAIGRMAGGVVPNPSAWGLDFAFVAFFVALLAGRYTGRWDLAPWLVAAVVACGVAALLPGTWYILLGALAGILMGVMRHDG